MSQSRQLAAIMFTDIVGYTALMGEDEHSAFNLLEANRLLQKPIIEGSGGRWIKEIGDGILSSFTTVSDAVLASIKIQEACNTNQDFQLRIGIHVAEVVFENDDVFGDGVNIAARIQSAAPPGCIFISDAVQKNLTNKKEIEVYFIKEAILKNVKNPVRLFQVMYPGNVRITAPQSVKIIDKNSIAVLPFVNMSSDPEQEYFSDGISEEVINMLAQVAELKVIGRTSSFAFKGKNMDLKLIGEQLQVNHILEGSVRKAGNRLRITAQLIEAETGYHLYSEKFDRKLEDIFDIQDSIALEILEATKIRLLGGQKESVLKGGTDNIEAHDQYLKARYHINKFTPDGFLTAIEYLDQAIAEDPAYAIAFVDKAFCYMNLRDFGWLPTAQSESPAREAAARAFELDKEIADCHLAIGRIKLHWDWKIDEAAASFRNALKINPNSAQGHVQLGMCLVLSGKNQEALVHAKSAEILDPISILNLWYLTTIPWYIGEFEAVLANGKRLIELESQAFSGYMWVGAGYYGLGHYDDAITNYETMVKLAAGAWTTSMLAVAYALKGDQPKAEELLKKIEGIAVESIDANRPIGDVHLALGNRKEAFASYNLAVDGGEGQMLWVIPTSKVIYPESLDDPAFQQILDRVGVYY